MIRTQSLVLVMELQGIWTRRCPSEITVFVFMWSKPHPDLLGWVDRFGRESACPPRPPARPTDDISLFVFIRRESLTSTKRLPKIQTKEKKPTLEIFCLQKKQKKDEEEEEEEEGKEEEEEEEEEEEGNRKEEGEIDPSLSPED